MHINTDDRLYATQLFSSFTLIHKRRDLKTSIILHLNLSAHFRQSGWAPGTEWKDYSHPQSLSPDYLIIQWYILLLLIALVCPLD